MCGIAGLIGPGANERLVKMLAALEHRGRDNEGIWVSDRTLQDSSQVGLGHRRLSIIDTSSDGNQPFTTPDGRFNITFNGEIYNYADLRAELEKLGESFRTQSDTEVLLIALRKWGLRALERLNGMFAFALWDEREKELTLVRDRAGIKPLFYSQNGEGIVFASEIKGVLASELFSPELDRKGLEDFLTFLWPVPPRTMFSNVKQLEPGKLARWKDGKLELEQWWDLDFSKEVKDPSRDWIKEAEQKLIESTRLEMVADVEVGAFLSGGVDSSSLVSLMRRFSEGKVSAYTTGITNEDLEYDIVPNDVEWSRIVAREFELDYHEQFQNPDLETLLPRLVCAFDAPIVDMAVPTYLISKDARRDLRVMLSGMGGDEVFAGYPRHLAMKLAGYSDAIPTAIRRPLFQTINRLLPGGRKGRWTAPLRNLKKFSKSASMSFEERYLGFGTYFDDSLRGRLLRPEASVKGYDPYQKHRAFFKHSEGWHPLNRLLYVDFKTFMPALNLDTTDRMSMANNLEVRVPFLNHELVSLSEMIPANLKLSGYTRKYVLKKAVEKHLPKEVIWRKKAGFSAPLRSWVRGKLKPILDDTLSSSSVIERGLFDPNVVDEILRKNESGQEDYNLQVFQLLTLELFMRQYFD